MDIAVENIVAFTRIAESLELDAIAKKLPQSDYDPESFPGLVLKQGSPATSVMLFKSGKAVAIGARDMDTVKVLFKDICKRLNQIGVKVPKDPEYTVQNIVATSDVGAAINLNAAAISLGLDKVEYEPARFPGLVYRLGDPNLVIIIYDSGKVVCTGGKTLKSIKEGIAQLEQDLRSVDLIK